MARKPISDDAAQTSTLDEMLKGIDPAAAESLKAELARLRADISELADAVTGVGKAGGSVLGEGAKAAMDAGRARFAGTQAEIEGFVREQPSRALITAAGIGMVLGLLLARR